MSRKLNSKTCKSLYRKVRSKFELSEIEMAQVPESLETQGTEDGRYPCRFKDFLGRNVTFVSKCIETRHSKMHISDRVLFPCAFEGCNRAFERKDGLDRHCVTVHQALYNYLKTFGNGSSDRACDDAKN